MLCRLSPVVEQVPGGLGPGQPLLHPGQPVDDRVVLPLEILKPVNGVISLKLAINNPDNFLSGKL